ncbi:hypothetical protein GQ42DRAFT_160563 [Ramicandelaber brevisporus]|nr:hypothetical protein GQ42DRAFT_160563 [Ramicandelaber brevisporus]
MLASLLATLVGCSPEDWQLLPSDGGSIGFCARHLIIDVYAILALLLLSLGLAWSAIRREKRLWQRLPLTREFYFSGKLETILDLIKPLVCFAIVYVQVNLLELAQYKRDHLSAVRVRALTASVAVWTIAALASTVLGLRRWLVRDGLAFSLQLAPLFLLAFPFSLPDLHHHFVKHGVPEHPSEQDYLILEHSGLTLTLFLLTIFTDRSSRRVAHSKSDATGNEDADSVLRDQSLEDTSSIFGWATFSWVFPVILNGNAKTLEPNDLWDLPDADDGDNAWARYQRKQKEGKSLLFNLWTMFKGQLALQLLFSTANMLLQFAGPMCLNGLLIYLQNRDTQPKAVGYMWAIGLFVCPTLATIFYQRPLWIGRHIGMQLRAIVTRAIVEKTLSLPFQAPETVVAPSDDSAESGESTEESNDNNATAKKSDKKDKKKKKKKSKVDDSRDEALEDEAKKLRAQQSTAGKVVNLLTSDVHRTTNAIAYLDMAYATPLQLVIGLYFLYDLLGVSAFIGLGSAALLLPVSNFAFKKLWKYVHISNGLNDKRVGMVNELMQGIRIIKMFGWGERFADRITSVREEQLDVVRRSFWYGVLVDIVMTVQPILITCVTFICYTVVFGHVLHPNIAFTSLTLFRIIKESLGSLPGLAQWFLTAKASIDRIDEFLGTEEVELLINRVAQAEAETAAVLDAPSTLGFNNATFQWTSIVKNDDTAATADSASTTDSSDEGTDSDAISITSTATSTSTAVSSVSGSGKALFQLNDLSVRFPAGAISVIAGATGSGKSSLLLALLGEMTRVSGEIVIPHEGELITDVAYVAQTAWLRNATIKENIVFGEKYDEQRYRAVLHACALNPDLRILPAGDATMVGEKGVTLSGGQKQRLALARAVYSRCNHVLLDDCLSAVDSDTARHIFKEAFLGPLMAGRTIVLVTHHVSLVAGAAKLVAVMHEGTLVAQGSPTDVLARGYLKSVTLEDIEESAALATAASTSRNDHSAVSDVDGAAAGEPLIQDEERASGKVSLDVYLLYGSAAGGILFWLGLATAALGTRGGNMIQDNWLRIWAAASEGDVVGSVSAMFGMMTVLVPGFSSSTNAAPTASSPSTLAASVVGFGPKNESTVSMFSTLAENVPHSLYYYVTVYCLLGLVQLVVKVILMAVEMWGTINASRRIHADLLNRLINATPRFFDRTPIGRILNRFSQDIRAVDNETMHWLYSLMEHCANAVFITVVVTYTIPSFMIVGVIIFGMGYYAMVIYLNVSRELKRIESNAMSPLLSLYGELTAGVTTIRAYGAVSRFIKECVELVNGFNRPFYLTWGTNRWLSFHMDILGALVSCYSAVIIVYNQDQYTAASAGFALSYALLFSNAALWIVRTYGLLEMAMNGVERISQYLVVDQEAAAVIPNSRPPASWPHKGEVVVRNLHARYAPDAPQVIKGINFNTKPGERIGIVGRTGAGKSSLGLLFLRMLEAESGCIEIDGIDISKIGLQDLRRNVVIIPQDPVLFDGTIRSNLDPFDDHDDTVLWEALRRAHLLGDEDIATATTTTTTTPDATATPSNAGSDSDSSLPTVQPVTSVELRSSAVFTSLDAQIREGGSNLSVGQRQLVALARALARSPRLLLLDEASSNVDFETDAKIQTTIRESFANSTILCVAHRLRTVVDYDRILVLDRGQVAEFDDPATLIEREGSIFRDMCMQTGEFEVLKTMAKTKSAF